VIAAVIAEGLAMIDYRTNRAVAAEAAFLTVVGSPVKSEGAAKDRPVATETERQGDSGKKRHNVYYIWMTPRTKVCEASNEWGAARQTQSQTEAQKRDVAFDRLEVGDHVEIQFTRSEETGANTATHQSERLRTKHGRDRTFVGQASSITIQPPMNAAEHSSSKFGEKTTETPKP
jgi:hypothetical protein